MHKNFAFISRHKPTYDQIQMALEKGVNLVHVGDADAFTVDADWVNDKGAFEGVVVVHPAAAMSLMSQFDVGVFKNENRAPVGEKPQFRASEFHIWYWANEEGYWERG